ncbi:MAG TPA: DNA gyrase inhibitor YacG [Vicinamibacterales bacterium]|nr:DNA gyrase inhibitor YacG [Vicinamibacterales bacterium]
MIVRMGKALLCVLCCKRPAVEQWRPFCSERCRNEDLARWATGQYRVASDPSASDAVPPSDDDLSEPD